MQLIFNMRPLGMANLGKSTAARIITTATTTPTSNSVIAAVRFWERRGFMTAGKDYWEPPPPAFMTA